ncbi:MAG: metal-sensitive transcriptional regulator [Clostridiales bacterium]|nr:metal-sensitive transcriptional regulator [Clostridiales bacterium]
MDEPRVYLDEETRKDLLQRLRRIEGQVRGVQGMVERREPCDTILTQISALRGAINQVGRILLEEHMRSCILEGLEESELKGELRRLQAALKTFLS